MVIRASRLTQFRKEGVLLFTFRFSLWMLLAVLLGQAIGLAALPGLITLISDKANVFTVILFPLLSGLHLAMLIHVGTAYQRARNEGESAENAVRTVFEKVFRSSAFAGLTSIPMPPMRPRFRRYGNSVSSAAWGWC